MSNSYYNGIKTRDKYQPCGYSVPDHIFEIITSKCLVDCPHFHSLVYSMLTLFCFIQCMQLTYMSQEKLPDQISKFTPEVFTCCPYFNPPLYLVLSFFCYLRCLEIQSGSLLAVPHRTFPRNFEDIKLLKARSGTYVGPFSMFPSISKYSRCSVLLSGSFLSSTYFFSIEKKSIPFFSREKSDILTYH